jgi:hypothetical protein
VQPPVTEPARRRALAVPVAIAAVAVTIVVAAAAVLAGAFGNGAGGCEDARRPGLDPALERSVPAMFEGRAPDRLDSATTCSAAGLGSLASHGIASIDSAGGLWELGPQTGVTLAVFRLARSDRADLMAEFYESGAASAPKVSGLRVSHTVVGTRHAPATRLDFSDADFPQAIVVWAGPDPDLVRVVLAAGVPDRVVDDAIGAFEPAG